MLRPVKQNLTNFPLRMHDFVRYIQGDGFPLGVLRKSSQFDSRQGHHIYNRIFVNYF
jgi:hypothetical protein